MDRVLPVAPTTKNLYRPVGDHFIGVHVGLSAGAGLPDYEREMVVKLAVDHFIRRLDDGGCGLRIEPAELTIDLGGGALDDAEAADDRGRLLFPANPEIVSRALGLCSPMAIDGHLHRAVAIRFGASWGSHEITCSPKLFVRLLLSDQAPPVNSSCGMRRG